MDKLENTETKHKLLTSDRYGPFTLDEWLEFKKNNDIQTEGRLDTKRDILVKFPRVTSIEVIIEKYEIDDETRMKKTKFNITHQVPVENRQHLPSKNQPPRKDKKVRRDRDRKDNRERDKVSKPKKKLSISDTQQNWRDIRPPLETVKKNTLNNDNKNTKKTQKDRIDNKNRLYTLVVKNLPSTYQDTKEYIDELENVFSKYGKISKINILATKTESIGFIDFSDKKSLDGILDKQIRLQGNLLYFTKKDVRPVRK